MEVSSPRQALALIGQQLERGSTTQMWPDVRDLVDAGLVAPQSCPADLLTEAAEALTALLKSDRNYPVAQAIAVESKARVALARILAGPPVAPTPPSLSLVPFAAPKDAAERWKLVLSIARGGFGGDQSARLQAIESLAATHGDDPAPVAPVPETVINAARSFLRSLEGKSVPGLTAGDAVALKAALAAYAPPKPPTTEELATALRNLAGPIDGGSREARAAALDLLDRMPK